MATRVGMVSLGCPKNQVDAEHMLYDLRKEGFQIVSDAALSDVVIINTCGFIESAKQEAIDTILEFCTLKQEGRIKAVIATGCLAERYRDEMKKEIPELDAVVGIGSNGKICDIIREILLDKQAVCSYGAKTELSMEGGRIISTEPFYAYIKIAEGCSNNCTYCAIPSIRGKYRSRRMEDIVKEARWLAENGVTELVVVAQDTTRYGEDIYGKSMLPELLTALCEIDGFKWIRTLYCYPERITDELLDVIAKEDKLVKYLDIPNVTLRTTLITGFPGETEEQFEELCEFVKEIRFERLGCFAYSPEEGTPAEKFEDQVPLKDRERRAEIIMEEQMIISDSLNEAALDSEVEVVCEGFDRYAECYYGRSQADAPEIDGKIFFLSEDKVRVGEYVKVKIDDTMDYDLIGSKM